MSDNDPYRAYLLENILPGDPNGPGVPQWQEFGATGKVMYFAVDTRSGPEEHRERSEFLDAMTID